jgi:thymidylate kinase
MKNNYEFARKSVEQKKYNRFTDCVEAYETLLAQYPQSSLIAEAKRIADEATNQIKKLDERKK